MRGRASGFSVTGAAFLAVAVLAGCAGAPERQARNQDELFAERRAQDAARGEASKRLVAQMLARAEAKARSPQATMDFLIVSGGGDWGAFGAGVLKGWGRVRARCGGRSSTSSPASAPAR